MRFCLITTGVPRYLRQTVRNYNQEQASATVCINANYTERQQYAQRARVRSGGNTQFTKGLPTLLYVEETVNLCTYGLCI